MLVKSILGTTSQDVLYHSHHRRKQMFLCESDERSVSTPPPPTSVSNRGVSQYLFDIRG